MEGKELRIKLIQDEFLRRKHQGLPKLERQQFTDDSRVLEDPFPQTIGSDPKIQQLLLQTIHSCHPKQRPADITLYEKVKLINFPALRALISKKEVRFSCFSIIVEP